MKRLSRYLFIECTLSTLIAVMVLTFVILLPQVLRLVDLWVNKGVSVSILGQMTLLVVPKFLMASLPMALLIGILLALGRLSQDSEIVVMKACGTSLYQIARPISILVLLVTALSLWLNWIGIPQSSRLFSSLKAAVVSTTTLAIKPRTFNQAIPGLTIYVHEQDQGGKRLQGLLIHDNRNPDRPVTLTAQSGQLHLTADGESALFLEQGGRHQKLADGGFRQMNFATYDLELGVSLGLKFQKNEEKLDQLGVMGLAAMIREGDPEQTHKARLLWHRRLALPTATFILGLLAVPLGLQQSHRSGRGYGFVVGVLILILHSLLLALGEATAKKQLADPLIGFWTPNLLMALLTAYVMQTTAQGRSFKAAQWLAQVLPTLPRRLLRPDSSFGKN
ncbi:MAG: LPS export ABC transporter permease LptF [Magnetococcales bacterium]|nr:LPS export ABC transporter permease LptF [Magnetococcales bacterium]